MSHINTHAIGKYVYRLQISMFVSVTSQIGNDENGKKKNKNENCVEGKS